MKEPKTIKIDDVEYIRSDEVSPAPDLKGMTYCIVRTYSAGCFAAYVEKDWSEDGVRCALLQKSRRLWYWEGANSLSQLANEGVKKPENCRFPQEINNQKVFNVIEIIPASKKAQESINSVNIWNYE